MCKNVFMKLNHLHLISYVSSLLLVELSVLPCFFLKGNYIRKLKKLIVYNAVELFEDDP
jgi:hypothetical protein